MNIDKNLLNSFAALDDDSLISTIRMIAAASGTDIGNIAFDKAQLAALRNAMRGASDADIAAIKNLFKDYKGNK